MQKIKIVSKTKESWKKDGEFDPPFLEIEVFEKEVLFDIGRRNQINEITSFLENIRNQSSKPWTIQTGVSVVI